MRSVVATLCLLLASTAARAEVGVGTGVGGGSGTDLLVPFILGVTEDPDPTPFVWRVFHGSGQPAIHVLNPNGEANGDGRPSILVDRTTGLVLVAWAMNSPAGFDVVVSRFQNGAWTTPSAVAGTPAQELDPSLVLDPDGSVHVFYWTDDGTTREVVHRTAPADLSSWSAPQTVSQPGESACRPYGVFHQSVLRVAYEVHDFGFGNTPRQVVLAREDEGSFVPEVVAITNNTGDVRPEAHSHAGKLWVDWIDATDGTIGEMGWSRLTPSGTWEPIHHEPFASAEERDYLVRGGIRMQAIQ